MITIPTLNQLYTSILSDLEAELIITIPLFGKNFLRAQAGVMAGVLWVYYKAIGLLQKNIFADTADSEANGGTLERFGRVKLGRNPFPATAGQYTVQLVGTLGQIIPASSTFKSNDTATSPGFLFILDNAFVLDGVDIITLRALTAGLDSRLSIGDKLTITGPVALVDSEVTVLTESVTPTAAETIEDYRAKVLDAYRLEPQGGAGSDYRIWSSEAIGVKQTYPYAGTAATSEVNLFVEATIADSSDGKGTPTGTILTAVTTAIEDPTADRPSRKPLTVIVNYLPVTIKEIDINITAAVGFTAAIQTAIFNAIEAELAVTRPFVSSIDILSAKNDIFDVNKIVSLVLTANPGSSFGVVTLEVDAVPLSTYTFTNGDIPYLNSITYV